MLSLARNLILARLLPVADFGIAATFSIAMSVIEMISSIGLQLQIIQAKDGDDPRLQSALQGFQAARGVLSSVLLFLAAGPIAEFMRLPDLVWAYQLSALVPLISGVSHFDSNRMNRQMRFGPGIAVALVPPIVGLICVWPSVLLFGDYRAMLALMLLQTVLSTAMSHLVAERRYQLRFDREVIRRSVSFGWPLILNNVLIFVVFYGDRTLVGRELGVEVLAIFSMGVTLTLTPTLVMAKSVRTLFLPQLSKAEDPERFTRLAIATFQAALLNGTAMMVGVVLIGGPFVTFVLGEKYADLLPYLGGLAGVQAMRVAKTGGAVVALSRGLTGNTAAGNVPRLLVLPFVWLALIQEAGIGTVILYALAAETAGYFVSLYLVRRRVGVSPRPLVPAIVMSFSLIAISMMPESLLPHDVKIVAALGIAVLQALTMPELRRRLPFPLGQARRRKK